MNIDGRISLNDCCCSKTLIGDAHLTIYAFPEFLFFTGEGKTSKSNLQEIDYVARTYILNVINSKVQFRIRNELHCTFRAFIPCKTFVVRTIRFSKVKKRPHEFIMFGFDLCILTFNDNFRGRGERGYGVERGGGGGTMGGAGDGGIGLV